ncbi:MAG: hypothetical protein N2C12_12675 [Planctomycetales bacterium]
MRGLKELNQMPGPVEPTGTGSLARAARAMLSGERFREDEE